MSKTITRLFDRYEDAQAAVAELERMGVPHSDVSLVANNADGKHDHHTAGPVDPDAAAHDARKGATTGGAIGAGAGLLAGLGIMAIPGLGPVVAAGWLVSTVVGAVGGAAAGGATGGLVGSLRHAGVSEADAHVYSEGVRRGGTLVSAKVDDTLCPQAEAALQQLKTTDVASRGADYRAAGWSAHDPAAVPYTADQVANERASYPVA